MTTALDDNVEDLIEDNPDLVLDDDPDDQDAGNDNDAAGDDDGRAAEGGDDEFDVVSLGKDAIAAEDEPEGMRNLRMRLREVERENKTLKAGAATKVDEVGAEPNIDDFWENPEEFAPALLAWNDRKRKSEEAGAELERLNQSVREDVEAGNRAYQEQRASLRIPGYEAADDKVVEALPEIFLNAVNLAAGDKAAALRFYLGTNPEQLGKLSALDPRKVTDLIKAAALAGAMAKEINVQRRKPATAPEQNRSNNGTSGGGNGAAGKTLERLEREAAQSGDRTQLIAYRRKLREQGKA